MKINKFFIQYNNSEYYYKFKKIYLMGVINLF